jgi:hypothetical protein
VHVRGDDPDEMHLPDAPDASNRAEADAYYIAARKRLGLLESSIQDTQCLFFASMYAKYCLQPLQAWFYIQQASARLQAHLLRRQRQPSLSLATLQLEQRLFWSCFRAERYSLPLSEPTQKGSINTKNGSLQKRDTDQFTSGAVNFYLRSVSAPVGSRTSPTLMPSLLRQMTLTCRRSATGRLEM